MRSKILVFISLSISMLGCASMYKDPTSGPVAKVRFSYDRGAHAVHVGTFVATEVCKKESNLPPFTHDGGEKQLLDMLPSERKTEWMTERLVPASQRVGVAVFDYGPVTSTSDGLSTSSCAIRFSFYADAGKQYEVRYRPTSTGCSTSVVELSGTVSNVIISPVDSFQLEKCDFEK